MPTNSGQGTRKGSQFRQTLEQAGYKVHVLYNDGYALLWNENDKLELWQRNDCYAGWVIAIRGIGYEFVRSID